MRMRRPRRPALGGLTINRLLPNILTTLALCAGMTAIRFGMQGKWEAAVLSIVVAAILDAMDGRIARLLNAQSKFGAELDSLSDVISFGVAPALLNYLWVLNGAGSFGWISALVLTVCAALRLARFNARLGASDLPPWAYRFFTGVPAPAGAGLAMLPMVLSFELGSDVVGHPIIVAPWIALVGGLMISRLPTFSFKGARIPHRFIFPILVGVGLVAASLVSAPWLTLAAIGVAYVISLPLSYRQFRELQRSPAYVETEVVPFTEEPVQTVQPDE